MIQTQEISEHETSGETPRTFRRKEKVTLTKAKIILASDILSGTLYSRIKSSGNYNLKPNIQYPENCYACKQIEF